jgi:hypothetical protein
MLSSAGFGLLARHKGRRIAWTHPPTSPWDRMIATRASTQSGRHSSSEFRRRLEVEFHQDQGSAGTPRILPLASTASQASFPQDCITDTEQYCYAGSSMVNSSRSSRQNRPSGCEACYSAGGLAGASRRSGALMSSPKAWTTPEKKGVIGLYRVGWSISASADVDDTLSGKAMCGIRFDGMTYVHLIGTADRPPLQR